MPISLSDVNLAGVLLHDAVADGETEAGALVLALLGLGFGGEEGVVRCGGGVPFRCRCLSPECGRIRDLRR